MNRIKELREARGLSTRGLADRAGTTSATISRLENGDRQLTEAWMRKIARALSCRPEELLAAPSLAEFREELTPYQLTDPIVADNLAARGLAMFEVKSNAVELAGVKLGDVVMIDMSPEAVANVQAGDIVVAQVYDHRNLLEAATVIRQFLPPGLLVTNCAGSNVAVTMKNAHFEAAIKGVVVQSSKSRPARP